MKTDVLLETIFSWNTGKNSFQQEISFKKYTKEIKYNLYYIWSPFCLFMITVLGNHKQTKMPALSLSKGIKIRVNPLYPYHPCSILKYSNYLIVKKSEAI